ncbi:MAG: hypothetical protein RIC55_08050 [Pirellulaceae bacterium]
MARRMPQTAEWKICSKCYRRLPLDEFAFHRRALGTRHADCKQCAVQAETERKRRKRIEDTHKFSQRVNRRISRGEPIEQMASEMIRRCRGIENFCDLWWEALEDAREKQKPHLALRQYNLLLNLMRETEKARPEPGTMSDEEIEQGALVEVMKMLKKNLPLVAWGAEQHGYALVPIESNSCESQGE